MFEFKVLNKYKNARTGIFNTPHGKLETPELAFVATEAEIKTIPKEVLHQLPIKYLIVNTFHISVKHILEKIQEQKGVHNYMDYHHVAASDSGGFQVFSMGFGKSHHVGKIGMFPNEKSKILNSKFQTNSKFKIENDQNNPLNISEEGVEFTFNDKKILLTPEKSMEIQQKIGADIMFAFDECTSPLNSKEYTKKAMERTHRWVRRSLLQLHKSQNLNIKLQINSNDKNSKSKTIKSLGNSGIENYLKIGACNLEFKPQALFAIVQGGYFQDLRKVSAQYMDKLDVPGFGIGGSLGTTEEEVRDVLEWTIPYLPDEKPRHLLGIGKVKDLFDGVERGVDLFDCVIPTREARHKVIYTKRGKIAIRKFKNVDEVIDKNCSCFACKEKITLYKLYELYKLKDPKAFFYATCHNVQFFSDLMKSIRQAIHHKMISDLKEEYHLYF